MYDAFDPKLMLLGGAPAPRATGTTGRTLRRSRHCEGPATSRFFGLVGKAMMLAALFGRRSGARSFNVRIAPAALASGTEGLP
jgi:hypothetical protein